MALSYGMDLKLFANISVTNQWDKNTTALSYRYNVVMITERLVVRGIAIGFMELESLCSHIYN